MSGGEGCREGLQEAGAEPGQFNRVKFNRVPEKVPVTHKPNC